MADKPNVTTTLKSLLAEVDDPEPYSIALSSSKVVTFPDPLAMEPEEAEKFLDDLNNAKPSVVLKKWLTEDEQEAFKAEGLNYRKQRHVLQSAARYYEQTQGDAGEGRGSGR